jgi:hypothetical protein
LPWSVSGGIFRRMFGAKSELKSSRILAVSYIAPFAADLPPSLRVNLMKMAATDLAYTAPAAAIGQRIRRQSLIANVLQDSLVALLAIAEIHVSKLCPSHSGGKDGNKLLIYVLRSRARNQLPCPAATPSMGSDLSPCVFAPPRPVLTVGQLPNCRIVTAPPHPVAAKAPMMTFLRMSSY